MSATDSAAKCFFGSERLRPTVIIVPISRIYDQLIQGVEGCESRGWYKCFMSGKSAVIKSYPGNSVIDVAYAAGVMPERIIHVGYCGSIEGKVGDIVVASSASHAQETGISIASSARINPPFPYREGPVVTVNSMLLDEDPQKLRRFCAVDMETYWLFRFSPAPSASIMVATDIPGREPFYDVDPEDPRIVDGMRNMVEYVKGLI